MIIENLMSGGTPGGSTPGGTTSNGDLQQPRLPSQGKQNLSINISTILNKNYILLKISIDHSPSSS
jgi:hypothetical protein